MIVYTAGPYRNRDGAGYVLQNIRQAEAVALKLWEAGYTVICPHKNTGLFDGLIDEDEILAGYCEIVARCDALVVLPGYEDSHGTLIEIQVALDAGIPVFYWPECASLLLTAQPQRPFQVSREETTTVTQHSNHCNCDRG